MNRRKRDEERENRFLAQEEEKIKFLEDNLKNCNDITRSLIDILTGFEAKLMGVEETLLPIHEATEALTTAQKNVSSSLDMVKQLADYHNLANEGEDTTQQRSIEHDCEEYLDWVRRVNLASVFFQQSLTFKGAEKDFRKLTDLSKKAKEDCQTEFSRVLALHSKPVALEVLVWPPTQPLELIPPNAVVRLGLIMERMDAAGHRADFLALLREHRSVCLKATLKRVIHENFNPNAIPEDKFAETDVARYRRGSHKAIFLLLFFLLLLEQELELLTTILQHTDMDPTQVDQAFAAQVEVPVEYFLKWTDHYIKEKGPNRVLILLDMLTSLKECQARYDVVIKGKPGAEIGEGSRMAEVRQSVVVQCQKAVSEYLDGIRNYVAVTKVTKKMKDGSVYTLTIETFNFLKLLSAYKDCINETPSILPPRAEDLVDAPSTALTMGILDALEENLQVKAKHLGKGPLSTIFLMNNTLHIAKLARKSALDVTRNFYEKHNDELQEHRDEYRALTWGKVLQLIDPKEARELALKAKDNVAAVKKKIKEKFSGFNTQFDEIFNAQREYSVPDSDLRSHLRNDSVEAVVRRYEEFKSILETVPFTTKKAKYIKYEPDVIEQMLNKLFDEEA